MQKTLRFSRQVCSEILVCLIQQLANVHRDNSNESSQGAVLSEVSEVSRLSCCSTVA
jgi:hypothetical protein